jgi:hypothetical protein
MHVAEEAVNGRVAGRGGGGGVRTAMMQSWAKAMKRVYAARFSGRGDTRHTWPLLIVMPAKRCR